MRKGRSSRRSRNSRPVSKAPPPTETLGAESTPSTPRIVLSSTPPPASLKTEAAQPSRVPSAPEPDAQTSEPPPRKSEPPPPEDATSNPPPETRPSATLPPPAHEEEPKEPPVTIASTDDIPRQPPPAASDEPAKDDDDEEAESAEHVAIQEQFFSEGDLSRHEHDDIEPMRPSKAVRMAEPAVVERRARYSRYVGWAVAGAAVVCLAALGRSLVGGPPEKPAPVLETRPGPPLTIEKPAEPKPAETVTPPEPSASASATPVAEAPAEAAAPIGDAKAEKKKAQAALEQRKIADAITAGEASVAIDPTDGEAWLILGAAYQEKGDIASARRSFAACVKEGKTGPVAECGKMLR